ncbi:MAG TPA: Rrf2 family transcriptional regulator [Bacteroidales bacterium]|nr:Rrf2 family transcriptional regulator [Bacteroidales bacterium]
MKFNTKTRYGIRTMMEIAMQDPQQGIFQKDIASKQRISFKYLDQIIAALKAGDLITNVGGKKSGYVLMTPASQITIYDIHKAFAPEINIVDCLSEMVDCEDIGHCAPRDLWKGLNDKIIEYLRNYTLQDLVDKQLRYKQNMNPQSSS